MADTTFYLYFDGLSTEQTLGLSGGDKQPKLFYIVEHFRPLPIDTQLDIVNIRFKVAQNEYYPERDKHYVHCIPVRMLTGEDKEELLTLAPKEGWLDMVLSLPF